MLDFLNGDMPAFIDTGLNVVDARDVARGHLLACERGRTGERYILGAENLTLAEILGKLAAITGRKAPAVRLPYAVAYCAGACSTAWAGLTGRPPRVPMDAVRMARKKMWVTHEKARRELGFEPGPADVALARAVAWFQGAWKPGRGYGGMKILMVAAEPREFAGVLSRAREVAPVQAAVDWSRRARLGEHQLWLVANGAGCRRAAAAVEAGCRVREPEAVVSTGFCGALEERLEVASVVVATEVASDREKWPARAISAGIHSTCGTIWCAERLVGTAAEKKALAETGACAVEMEAAGVAEARKRAGFAVLLCARCNGFGARKPGQ